MRYVNKNKMKGENVSVLVGRMFANGPGARYSIPGQVISKTQK